MASWMIDGGIGQGLLLGAVWLGLPRGGVQLNQRGLFYPSRFLLKFKTYYRRLSPCAINPSFWQQAFSFLRHSCWADARARRLLRLRPVRLHRVRTPMGVWLLRHQPTPRTRLRLPVRGRA